MNRRGSVPLMVGALLVTLLGGLGVAVDGARAWLLEARLRAAVDAAGLFAARNIDGSGTRVESPIFQDPIKSVFFLNLLQNGAFQDFLGATISDSDVVIARDPTNPNRVTVTATARLQTTLFSLLGERTVTVRHATTAQRVAVGVELAIVVDESDSMLDSSGIGGTTKIDQVKIAIRDELLNILYAGQETQPNLSVAVVPFARTINIGRDNFRMLDTTGMPPGWNPTAWTGCVEARTNGADLTDVGPDVALFRPYFWPTTFRQVGFSSGGVGPSRCFDSNAWPADGNGIRWCHGDNDWLELGTPPRRRSPAEMVGNHFYDFLRSRGLTHDDATGPNLLCARTPILPLNTSRSVVQDRVNNITPAPRSQGTTTAVGLQGAWYTLSPRWNGAWQGGDPSLPVAYDTPNTRKVVVMLTDGDNIWRDSTWEIPGIVGTTNICGSSARSVCSSVTGDELLYNAYGRVNGPGGWNARFPDAPISPVSTAAANSQLDARFAATCDAMKGTGIIIYIVGFEVAAVDEPALRRCATDANGVVRYFPADDSRALQRAFRDIANQIASLSLVQ